MLLAVTRYDVPEPEAAQFLELARPALSALLARPGCHDGQVARATDDSTVWLLVTRWESVGSYRRALSHPEVKVHAVPLMYRCRDEPSAFEALLEAGPDGVVEHASDLADEPTGR